MGGILTQGKKLMPRITKNSVGWIILFALVSPLPALAQAETSPETPQQEKVPAETRRAPSSFDADSFIIDRNPEALFGVSKVISGNTILLDNGEVVRLLGVEIPDDFGVEAHRFLKGLLEGKEIKLVFERRNRNIEGQLLAYVFRDGISVNNLMKEKAIYYSHIDPSFSYTPAFLYKIFPKEGEPMDSWEIIFGEARPIVMKAKVVLKNKQTLHGELVKETPDYIILKRMFYGKEIIEKENIAQLSFE